MRPKARIPLLLALTCLLYPACKPSAEKDYKRVAANILEGQIQIGISRVDITPEESIRLSGYGNRTQPSEGVRGKLWAKAIAMGEGEEPAVLVTLDLIGVPAWLSKAVVEALDISESKLAICATHTHSGPHLRDTLNPIYMADIPAGQREAIERYSDILVDKVVQVCRNAMNHRQPGGSIEWGKGVVGFAVNRRVLENGKWTGFGKQDDGPVDHSLPIMKISDSRGNLAGILANYACHCTTLGGDFNQIHGDWAGEAQKLLEERHPGITAMITIGCGADANPYPRGGMSMVLQHGKSLADEVDRLLGTKLTPLSSEPSTQLDRISLPLDPLPSRQYWEELAASENRTAWYAKQILKRLDKDEQLTTSIDYPIQTWTFGTGLAMVFLAGEVVVDYSLKLKERFDGDRLWVNAYANASPSYIASRRLYDEGGYEVDRSMYYYDKPNRLSPDTEDLVLDEILQQLPSTFYSEDTLNRIPAPISKDHALATMQVHPDLQIELVAAEPLVKDPIDIAWGPDGSMWVVEMADYPLGIDGRGQGGGRIRHLEDSDRDGKYDKSTVFLEVPYPTSVFPWNNGVLVTSAPDIIYARDADSDGKADEVKPLYTGFKLGNQQHLVNGMQWGLDGWIYLANGDSGGEVRAVGSDRAIDIAGWDLKIRPESGKIETVNGRSQFGRNRDSWGNWFGNSNSWPGWHYALDHQYLRRNPFVDYSSARVFLPEIPSAGPVYPISKTLSRFNDYEKSNRFTSACGFMIYEDNALGEAFQGNSFIAEPVHNLVSRAVMYPMASTFRSERAPEEKESEFLRSTDNWFRPTSIRSGPDGALYITDMYRLVIEHPQWIPEDWQRKLDLREGHDKGRIYRIAKKGSKQLPALDMTRLSASELVAMLNSDIRWQRDQAHQMLVLRDDGKAVSALQMTVSRAGKPEARGQALWILKALGKLDPGALLEGLNDEVAGVRVQAVRLSDSFLNDPDVLQKVAQLAADENAQVRIQVAYTLGDSGAKLAGDTLFQLVQKYHRDPLLLSATLSSARPHQLMLAKQAGDSLLLPEFRALLQGLLETSLGENNRECMLFLLALILNNPREQPLENHLAAYQQFQSIARRFSRDSFALINSNPELVAGENELFQAARDLVKDPDAPVDLRITALSVLAHQSTNKRANASLALQLLGPRNPTALQIAAVESVAGILGPQSPQALLENWEERVPGVRGKILDTLLSKKNWTTQLLETVAQNKALAKSFSTAQIGRLIRSEDARIAELAEAAFGHFANSDRRKLVRDYQKAINLAGNPEAGRGHFSSLCATCHNMDGMGVEVGPDLTALSDKSPQALLTAILDPNQAVENKFTQFIATTKDGRSAVGILSEETSGSVTLTTTGGIKQTFWRQNLGSLESNGLSLMPDGLEASLDHQQMADLLAFLNASDESLKIRAAKNGEISLLASRGITSGPSAYYNPGNEAIEWIVPGDSIAWTVYDLKPGRYDIFCDAGLKVAHNGRPFRLHMNDTFVTGAVPVSGSMENFRKRKFGNIEIETGSPKAVFRLEHTLSNAEFGLREIRLIPVQ